jgi:hypothetical protein
MKVNTKSHFNKVGFCIFDLKIPFTHSGKMLVKKMRYRLNSLLGNSRSQMPARRVDRTAVQTKAHQDGFRALFVKRH